MRSRHLLVLSCIAVCVGLALGSSVPAAAGEEASVTGTFTANGETKALPYVYVYKLAKGFYDDSDPTFKLLFVEKPIEERELDEHIWDAAYVELGITRTSEFDEQPTWQVYSQNIVLSADSGGNVSGGTYPELELTSSGPERFAGKVYVKQELDFFGDKVKYDFTFSAPLSDPDAPIGEPLPAGGGEPGKAYAAWVAALHSGEVERIKKLVPPDMVSQLDAEDAAESIEFMQMMTPTEIKVLGGSSDGETAILKVEGMMDGEKVQGEITMKNMDGRWIATKSAW